MFQLKTTGKYSCLVHTTEQWQQNAGPMEIKNEASKEKPPTKTTNKKKCFYFEHRPLWRGLDERAVEVDDPRAARVLKHERHLARGTATAA
jgi:hypothetical protein